MFSLSACSKDDAKISALALDVSDEYLVAGDTMTLAVTISPSDASAKGIVWSSSNADVASVENGKVTALSAGTAAITASAANGSKTASCNITVGNMYVCLREGFSESELGNAFIWKNGEKQLMKNDAEKDFTVESMFVDGNDVYAAGFTEDESPNTWPVLWKNGDIQILQHTEYSGPYSHSDARSVYISDSDIYVVGSDIDSESHFMAVMWKNGVETTINDGLGAMAYSVCVSDNSVYVAGITRYKDKINQSTVTVWKDGIAEYLTDYATERSGAAGPLICKSGNDVYVSCPVWSNDYNCSVIILWKNGVRTYLSDGKHEARANSLCAYKEDSFVAGCLFDGSLFVAQLWKNGSPIILHNGGESNSSAMSACVFGDKVYVTGYVLSPSETLTCLWTVDCSSGEVLSERVIAVNEIPYCIVVK